MIDELNHSTDEPRPDANGAPTEAFGSGAGPATTGDEPATDTAVSAEVSDAPAETASEGSAIEGSAPADDAATASSTSEGSSEPVRSEPETTKPERKPRTRKSEPTASVPAPAAQASGGDEIDSAPKPTGQRDWYILKVQSNREDSIREALQRKIAMEGLNDYFGDIIVPIEMVSEFKNGKKRIVKRKLYPGYIVVHMELNDDTWFLVRETHGIGDFTGSGGKPSPMLAHEVARILSKQEEKTDEAPKLKISFRSGDRVKITEGTFENFEGDVDAIDEANGRVTVMINIFGRSTPVELEYWQVESL